MDNYNPNSNNGYNNYNNNYNNYNSNLNRNYNNYNGYNNGYNNAANSSNYNAGNYNSNAYSNGNYNGNAYNNNYYNNGYNNSYNNNYNNGYANNAYYGADYNNQNSIVFTTRTGRTLVISEVVSKSFLFMFMGLLITAAAAALTSPEFAIDIMSSGSYFLLVLAELGIVFGSNYAVRKRKPILASCLFIVYSFVTGMTFSILFLAYTTASLVSVFLITAIVFAVMAVYGLVTKNDLTSVGSLCFMGLLGIIIAMMVNFFIGSTVADTAICCIGILIFIALTAYDTQKIKKLAEGVTDRDEIICFAMYGAFELYLDFINLFLKLLRIIGIFSNKD